MAQEKVYFQNYMAGNICFGCGNQHPEGLQIKSHWEGEEAICEWHPQEKYQGWKGLMNGGILATLIDCHCMCTAMAAAYKQEHRGLNSEPLYRYATGTMNVVYVAPTPSTHPIILKAQVKELKGKKVVLDCQVYSQGKLTAKAEVVALRVFDSSSKHNLPAFSEM